MMQSIAIQAYFAQMRHFFTRQGFDGSMKVVYGADAEGPQRLLDQDMADKDMDRKRQTNRDTVRSGPYTYLFWTKDSLKNIIRRPVYLRDGIAESGAAKFKKTVSVEFGMGCVLISNKANLIEDFSEAFAAEYQNMHTVPINLKFGYNDRSGILEGGFDTGDSLTNGLHFTVINELGTEELISFRQGNLFSYSWNTTFKLNVLSEFADKQISKLKEVVVDLYNPQGVPLSSMDLKTEYQFDPDIKYAEKKDIVGMAEKFPEKDAPGLGAMEIKDGDYTAVDGTVVHAVPERPYVSVNATEDSGSVDAP